MKLAKKVLNLYRENSAEAELKSILSHDPIKDFISPDHIDYFWAETTDGDYEVNDFEVTLYIPNVKELIKDQLGDIPDEEASDLADKLPLLIKNKTFKVSGFKGDVINNDVKEEAVTIKPIINNKIVERDSVERMDIRDFKLTVKKASYDNVKDVLICSDVIVDSATLS